MYSQATNTSGGLERRKEVKRDSRPSVSIELTGSGFPTVARPSESNSNRQAVKRWPCLLAELTKMEGSSNLLSRLSTYSPDIPQATGTLPTYSKVAS